MQVILDEPMGQQNSSAVKYGTFWLRFAALLVDGIILAPISFGVTYFNITSWKSASVMLVITMIGISYKPFMEFNYGATLGKMALKLKVTDLQFQQPNLQTILLRNVFHIVPTLITSVLSIGMYTDPDFEMVTGYMEFVTFSQQFAATQLVSTISGLITLIDAIMLAVDDQKRSLHDRIAGTLVIEKP